MTTPTLPGTIPGLLRRTTPVIVTRGEWIGLRGIVKSIADGLAVVALDNLSVSAVMTFALDELGLDLSDPTGRAHAAWWLNDHDEDTLAQATRAVSGVDDCEAWRWLIVSATSGDAWPDARVEYLRLVCLHVAGVSHG